SPGRSRLAVSFHQSRKNKSPRSRVSRLLDRRTKRRAQRPDRTARPSPRRVRQKEDRPVGEMQPYPRARLPARHRGEPTRTSATPCQDFRFVATAMNRPLPRSTSRRHSNLHQSGCPTEATPWLQSLKYRPEEDGESFLLPSHP